jgi:hypothetical protein
MAKKRGNPSWGKPELVGSAMSIITEFEQAVREFKLRPDQFIRSVPLREWTSRNKNAKYICKYLLEA